ncbi:hypothetical protein [Pseudomonas sp. MF6396]|uniref:hypothetical protein n=1 Tax=Pseudomonas sp. MF6396 TaxID=1960828 RepID=UPI00129042ED|nr:hypothetical protein [Pseudomonas sp. MF6396]
MIIFKKTPTLYEQLETGNISFASAIKLSRLAFLVSKRRFVEYYLPFLALVATVLACSKFLHSEGRPPSHYVGIPMMYFAWCSFFVVKLFWANKGRSYLEWVEDMFGPKTCKAVLDFFLAGEHYDVVQEAKAQGEYVSSLYVKSLKHSSTAQRSE